jgi:ParB-like chromosome segregation protein Spo0J
MEKVKISKVVPNENNPRFIKDYKFKKLVKSIQDFPEMLKLRPIVVNKDMVVLGGNMRLKACKEAGLKEVYILKADELTEQQQREFIVKDNVGFGEWDWDILANEWDNQQLKEWGMDVWQPEEEVDYSALEDLDLDETIEDKEAGVKRAIMIEFDPKHYDQANELITQARKEGKNVGLIVLNAFKDNI